MRSTVNGTRDQRLQKKLTGYSNGQQFADQHIEEEDEEELKREYELSLAQEAEYQKDFGYAYQTAQNNMENPSFNNGQQSAGFQKQPSFEKPPSSKQSNVNSRGFSTAQNFQQARMKEVLSNAQTPANIGNRIPSGQSNVISTY